MSESIIKKDGACKTMRTVKFVWNIPNALSLFRLLLLPLFAVLYLCGQLYWAVAILVLSGLSDMFDGLIARKCNQITEIGKLLDPIADKVTQIVVLVCLTATYPALVPLFIVCFIKELLQAIGGWILLSRNAVIRSSNWYGKVSTILFYIAMCLVAVWTDMPRGVMIAVVSVVALAMLFAFFMYMRVFIKFSAKTRNQ